jgi:hypothetical protein
MKPMVNKNRIALCSKFSISYINADSHTRQVVRYDESSPLSDIQKHGKNYKGKKYQKLEEYYLNPQQVKLYRLAMYGLDALQEDELRRLSFGEKLKIRQQQEITQRNINRWKQKIVSEAVSDFLKSLFPNTKSNLIRSMIEDDDYTSDGDINKMPFEALGITQKMRIQKMIEWGTLPEQFFNLTP